MKTPIRRLDSLTHNDTAATKLINDNFEALQQGVEDALSRSGKKPNFMDDVLDMNMHRIINIADPVDDYDLANKHYVDTKVAEEEAARISGDNALRGLIDDEKTARQNADNAIINSIGNGTITLTQGGTVKGTFTTNQKTNVTIDLDAGGGSGSGDKSIYLKNQTMTFAVNSGNAFLDVSNYVENGVAYCPIVFIHIPDRSITPQATYNVTNKYVYLNRNSAYASVQNTVTVDVCLIPVDTNETDINGLSDGLYYAQYLFINKSDITTNITSSSTDTQVPSAKCVYDIVGNIETLLQSI